MGFENMIKSKNVPTAEKRWGCRFRSRHQQKWPWACLAGVEKSQPESMWDEHSVGRRGGGRQRVQWELNFALFLHIDYTYFSYVLTLKQGVFLPDSVQMTLFHFYLLFASFLSKSKLLALTCAVGP